MNSPGGLHRMQAYPFQNAFYSGHNFAFSVHVWVDGVYDSSYLHFVHLFVYTLNISSEEHSIQVVLSEDGNGWVVGQVLVKPDVRMDSTFLLYSSGVSFPYTHFLSVVSWASLVVGRHCLARSSK